MSKRIVSAMDIIHGRVDNNTLQKSEEIQRIHQKYALGSYYNPDSTDTLSWCTRRVESLADQFQTEAKKLYATLDNNVAQKFGKSKSNWSDEEYNVICDISNNTEVPRFSGYVQEHEIMITKYARLISNSNTMEEADSYAQQVALEHDKLFASISVRKETILEKFSKAISQVNQPEIKKPQYSNAPINQGVDHKDWVKKSELEEMIKNYKQEMHNVMQSLKEKDNVINSQADQLKEKDHIIMEKDGQLKEKDFIIEGDKIEKKHLQEKITDQAKIITEKTEDIKDLKEDKIHLKDLLKKSDLIIEQKDTKYTEMKNKMENMLGMNFPNSHHNDDVEVFGADSFSIGKTTNSIILDEVNNHDN